MTRAGGLVVVIAAGALACTTPAPAPAESPLTRAPDAPVVAPASVPADAPLYERLGGKPAIEVVVDEFLKNVAADARIAHRFAISDLRDLRQKLVDLVCQSTGGPCTYTGADMKAAHKGQRVSSADFDALVEDLAKALDTHKVPAREKGELLAALASMKSAVVEVP